MKKVIRPQSAQPSRVKETAQETMYTASTSKSRKNTATSQNGVG